MTKSIICSKVLNDFHLKLPNSKEQDKDLESAKVLFNEAVSLIREKVKNGRLILNYNIQYGFIRNLIGGSVVGILLSIANSVFFKNLLL